MSNEFDPLPPQKREGEKLAIPVYLRAPLPLPISAKEPLEVIVTNPPAVLNPLPITAKMPLDVVVINQSSPPSPLPSLFTKGRRVTRYPFLGEALTQPTERVSLVVGNVHGEWAQLGTQGAADDPWHHIPSMNSTWA